VVFWGDNRQEVSMVDFSRIKRGITIRFKDDLWDVSEYDHVKPGKGGAFVRVKLKNFLTGRVLDNTFNIEETMFNVFIDRKKVEYLYRDGDQFVVMDQETYDQIFVDRSIMEPLLPYLRENDPLTIVMHDGRVLKALLPRFVELEVTESLPWVKGDTATSEFKPVTVETGIQIKVPSYIKQGEVVKIDTISGDFVSRASRGSS
jgi:elongation factor P